MFKVKENYENKIKGALYGFAIGDAMGATTEFMDAQQIRNEYGIVKDILGGGWLHLRKGEITDDTEMTMCVMDAIMSKEGFVYILDACLHNFRIWLKSEPLDVGGQCRLAIKNGNYAKRDNALGNGSLMRAMPCALLGMHELNVSQGRLTHNNNVCDKIIMSYSKELHNILHNDTIKSSIEVKSEPTGHILNTYNNANYWLTTTNSFEEAIIGAVNDGGDADTIAAITGSLAGCKYGYDMIPKRWIEDLFKNVREYLDMFAVYIIYNI